MKSPYDLTNYLEISAGCWQRFSVENCFGRNPDVGTGTDPEDVWNGASLAPQQTYMAAATALNISSSNNADTQVIAVDYLDHDWRRQTGLVTLVGQTETATGITAVRVLGMYNTSATALLGDVYLYENDTVVAGVPTTPALLHCKIDIGRERSQNGHFTIPRFHRGFVVQLWASINNDLGWARMGLYLRQPGGVFQIYPEIGLDEVRSKFIEVKPVVPITLTQMTDIRWTCTEVGKDNIDVSAGFSIILEPIEH